MENANNAVNDAVRNANAEWNKFVRMANESLPPGSSLPHNPLPAPKVSGLQAWAPQAKAPIAPGRNGEIVGVGRSYLVWVPANYNPARPTPVMVGYSAYQDSTENFRNYSRLRESAVGQNATRVSARGCAKGVQVIQVHGSNHYWWYSPSAADELWWFLSRHAK